MTKNKAQNSYTEENFALQALPGIGYFGYEDATCLQISIKTIVDRVTIGISPSAPEYFNVNEISFYDEFDTKLCLKTICKTVLFSSLYGDATYTSSLEAFLKGEFLHTDLERRPYISIDLNSKVFIKYIQIRNRKDQYGLRSKHLFVECFHSGILCKHWQNISTTHIKSKFRELINDLKYSNNAKHAYLTPNFRRNPSEIKQELCHAISSGTYTGNPRTAAYTLDIYNPDALFHDDDLTIISYIALKSSCFSTCISTDVLSMFQFLLRSEYHITLLCNTISKISKQYTGESKYFFASKHSLRVDTLEQSKNKYLNAVESLISIFYDFNVSAMICYGTLLGAMRNKSFIPHDDDVDVLYFDGSQSKEEAETNKVNIGKHLTLSGYAVTMLDSLNFHVEINGITIDIFPSWQQNETTYLMMENGEIRALNNSILFPTRKIQLYDRFFPAPAQPASFLNERYGDWKYPDPFHEWPWRLEPSARHTINNLPTINSPEIIKEIDGSDLCNGHYISLYKAIDEISPGGDWAQFGVCSNNCLKFLSNFLPKSTFLHLFENFDSLSFCSINKMSSDTFTLNDNYNKICYYNKEYPDTIASFLDTATCPLSFIHISKCSYNSTKDILCSFNKLIIPGTVILFNEYTTESNMVANEDQHRATTEWKIKYGRQIQYLWRTNGMQVAVRVL